MNMVYKSAVKYLEDCCKFGSKQGLENFSNLMSLFGNPQNSLKIVHVAGTNGKGSVCRMLFSVLREQGYRVGVFSSPHMKKYNERLMVDGKFISDEDFAVYISKVKKNVDILFGNSGEYFSFFEIITAAAFNYFFDSNVDFVILEVGMGGRLDSTNIIETPLLSVITSISFDHTEYLGNSIEKIAFEKGGIIKENCPVVLYSQSEEVYKVIKDICDSKNSELFYLKNYNAEITSSSFDKVIFNVSNEYFKYSNIAISMIGLYQVYNACNVFTVIEALRRQGIVIENDSVVKGVGKAVLQGRMEIMQKDPFLILEGAHNIDGVEQLSLFIKNVRKNYDGKIIIVVGILKDKEYKQMLYKLLEFCDILILTEPTNKRCATVNELSESLKNSKKFVFVQSDFKKAVDYAIGVAEKEDFIFCTGSLYLISDIREYIDKKILRKNFQAVSDMKEIIFTGGLLSD